MGYIVIVNTLNYIIIVWESWWNTPQSCCVIAWSPEGVLLRGHLFYSPSRLTCLLWLEQLVCNGASWAQKQTSSTMTLLRFAWELSPRRLAHPLRVALFGRAWSLKKYEYSLSRGNTSLGADFERWQPHATSSSCSIFSGVKLSAPSTCIRASLPLSSPMEL